MMSDAAAAAPGVSPGGFLSRFSGLLWRKPGLLLVLLLAPPVLLGMTLGSSLVL